MLRVTLLGNLGADPEVRYTTKGHADGDVPRGGQSGQNRA